MRKLFLMILLVSWLDAHSRLVMKRSYKYYKLGYDYSQTIVDDKSGEMAFEIAKKMCVDVVGTPYMNTIYKESCIFGAEDVRDRIEKRDLDSFLNSPIHIK